MEIIKKLLAVTGVGFALLASGLVTKTTADGKTNHNLETPPEIAPITAPFPMPQLMRQVFPSRIFNIADYGAKDDGTTKNTEVFRKTIAACNAAGGGTVLVPRGKWLTGAIHLKSNVNLHMEEGAEIHFSDNPNDYLPVVFTRWGGVEVMNYSPLIYAKGCDNIAITGPGKLFGHGQKWWPWCERLNEKDKVGPKLQDMAVKGVPPAKRIFATPMSVCARNSSARSIAAMCCWRDLPLPNLARIGPLIWFTARTSLPES